MGAHGTLLASGAILLAFLLPPGAILLLLPSGAILLLSDSMLRSPYAEPLSGNATAASSLRSHGRALSRPHGARGPMPVLLLAIRLILCHGLWFPVVSGGGIMYAARKPRASRRKVCPGILPLQEAHHRDLALGTARPPDDLLRSS